jgi:hypothetical protein
MPFDVPTKTEMFTRCGRLCCLCLKQCGTNFEAAHIVDEADGGSNDADNGIPTCFDCHQEIGAYSNKHPKGNKFRPEELKARRDRIYHLVDTGIIYAQVFAAQSRSHSTAAALPDLAAITIPAKASNDAIRFLDLLVSSDGPPPGVARKIALLNQNDRALVMDKLVRKVTEGAPLIPVLAELIRGAAMPHNEAVLIAEQVIRALTLHGDVSSKSDFLRAFPGDVVVGVYEGLRLAFFEDVISVVKRDQFVDVNKLVPPLVTHTQAIPPELHREYVFALLQQAKSGSYLGAPAAQEALEGLPDAVAAPALLGIDEDFLTWRFQDEALKKFVSRYKHLGQPTKKKLLDDFTELSWSDFVTKYLPNEP